MSNSRVPPWLVGRLSALVLVAGFSGATYFWGSQVTEEALRDEYVQAVATDGGTSKAVKVAMVLGSFYESSGKHIGRAYIDKLGKGQPLTVCNGITGAGVVAGKWYSPAECYKLEKGRYLQAERAAQRLLAYWASYDAFVQGQFIDFIHNKGEANFASSTMRRKANAGDLMGACRENPRWNKGTVNGQSTVLPGLQSRGLSNDEICREWRVGAR